MTEDAYRKIFSENLKRIMRERGTTQMDLMNALNIPSATISTWVNGQRMPKMSKVQMLAEYFNIDPMDLIQEKPPVSTLSDDDESLLRQYKRLSSYQQGLVKALMKAMVENEH